MEEGPPIEGATLVPHGLLALLLELPATELSGEVSLTRFGEADKGKEAGESACEAEGGGGAAIAASRPSTSFHAALSDASC